MPDVFQLQLRLHTPVILPTVVPRLDVLLAEATRRLRLDWESPVEDLPLVFDQEQGGYRCSQVIFGTTKYHGLEAHPIKYSSFVTGLPLSQVRNTGKKATKIKLDGGGTAPKLTRHAAHLSPYLIFYGEGDAERCAQLLGLLGGVGLEHAKGQGYFTVENVMADDQDRWQKRPWRTRQMHKGQGYSAVPDILSMTVDGEDEAVHRPPRLIKEVVL